jgi:hypothetical protein
MAPSSKELYTVRIEFSSPVGELGVDDDRGNPLSRALDTILRTGKPIKKLAHCFFVDQTTGGEHWRWIGIFVLSVAGSVIYFPGYSRTFDEFVIVLKGRRDDYGFHPDHMTLENDFKSLHLTSTQSKEHSRKPLPTLDLGVGRRLWFGMSVNPNELRELRAQTVAEAECPKSDSERRVKSFMDAREGQIFLGVCLDPRTVVGRVPGFLHVSVVVGPLGFPDYYGPELGIPYGSPFLAEEPPPLHRLSDLPCRLHRLALGDKVELQLTSVWLPGRLKDNVGIALTSHELTKARR